MNEAQERMAKARTGLIISQPFFGMLALRLELVEDPKAASTWVDGHRLGYNPEWVSEQTIEVLEGAIAHQVLHCALGHPFRRAMRQEKQWGEACDYAVNAELKSAGFHLAADALYDPRFDKSYAEAIYAALDQEQEQGEDPGGDGNTTRDTTPDARTEESTGSEQGDGKGSGEPTSDGELRDCPEQSEAEVAEAEAEWQTATAQAAQASRAQGKLPGSIERALQEALNPRADWREVLQRLLRSRAKDDYSWSRPNRKYLPIYLPSLDSLRCGPLVVAVDASGSIGQKWFDQFAAELTDISERVKPEYIQVLIFDTKVREQIRFEPGEEIVLKARAGGGTAFDDPVRWIEQEGLNPEALVYLTDLESSVFPADPGYPVIWATTGRKIAPFGETVMLY